MSCTSLLMGLQLMIADLLEERGRSLLRPMAVHIPFLRRGGFTPTVSEACKMFRHDFHLLSSNGASRIPSFPD